MSYMVCWFGLRTSAFSVCVMSQSRPGGAGCTDRQVLAQRLSCLLASAVRVGQSIQLEFLYPGTLYMHV